jgi:hypothetical protein
MMKSPPAAKKLESRDLRPIKSRKSRANSVVLGSMSIVEEISGALLQDMHVTTAVGIETRTNDTQIVV